MQKTWLKDIKGMWVATYTEGRMIGVVNNIYIDPLTKSVTGFALRAGAPLGGQEVWVANNNIKKLGADLIFLPTVEALSKEQIQGKKLAQLIGMQVSTKDGRVMGQLNDLAVNLDNWELTDILLSNNKTIAIDIVETVLGKDLILVQSNAEVVEKEKERKETIIESVFGKDFVKQTSDVLKRVLKGNEADLHEKAESVSSEEKTEESLADDEQSK